MSQNKTTRDYSIPSQIVCWAVACYVLCLALYAAQQVLGLGRTVRDGDRIVRTWPIVEGQR